MEFYQLEYFRVLCKYGSYTQASRELNVSQPTVSMTVKKLEDECQGSLIERNSKSFALTPRGEVLLKWAVTFHNDMEGLQNEMDAFSVRKREVVRFAFPIPLCPEILNELTYDDFYNRGITLHIQQDGHTSIVANLLNGSVDVGIIGKDFLVPSLDYFDFRKVEYWVCFSENHKFNNIDVITADMLRGETVLVSKAKNLISKSILEDAVKYGFYDQLKYLDVIPEEIGKHVQSGDGIAFMPKNSCKGCCAPLFPPYYCQLVVVWRKDRSLTRENRRLVEFLRGLAERPD